jgi:capsular exopolysaccharide synthesis family protein
LSRTYEMLQRLEKEQELSPAQPAQLIPVVRPEQRNGKPLGVGEEEVLKLVQRVFRSSATDAPRVVVFSGIGHGDGCSWISASAALTLAAQTNASICLVDANFRTPSLHRSFDVENRFGLADALAQPGPVRSFAQQISGSNLWVLTSGPLPALSSAAALSSEAMRARFAELRSEFDYVLVDTAPTNLYADAVTIGRVSDGMILVLQSNTTRREAAMKAKESMQLANVRLLGAVLNKRTYPIPQKLYDRF